MPTSHGLPDGVESFVLEYLDSYGKLEVLMLVARDPTRTWTAASVNEDLRSSPSSAAMYLSELCRQGLLGQVDGNPPRFRFQPSSPELRAVVERFMSSFPTFQTRIMRLIYERPVQRIKDFADAFKLRKDPDDG